MPIVNDRRLLFETLRARGYRYNENVKPEEVTHIILLGGAGVPFRFWNYIPVRRSDMSDRAKLHFHVRRLSSSEKKRVVVPIEDSGDLLPCIGDLLDMFFNSENKV